MADPMFRKSAPKQAALSDPAVRRAYGARRSGVGVALNLALLFWFGTARIRGLGRGRLFDA